MPGPAKRKIEGLSDPCQVLVKTPKGKEICGKKFKSLYAHLKSHKITAKQYQKQFRGFSLGEPPNRPAPDAIRKATEVQVQKARDRHEYSQAVENTDFASIQKKIEARATELWAQVNNDIPARQFAFEAARCEVRLEELNRRYDAAFKTEQYKNMESLNKEISDQLKFLKSCMETLDLTVKNRRENNKLGNDTVSQLISNYGGTLRRWSPEKRDAFEARVKEVRRIQAERIRMKLSEILDEKIDEVAEVKPMTESEIDARINDFIKRANQ